VADTGPRGGRCVALSFHVHVGVCERAGYRNGAADALEQLLARFTDADGVIDGAIDTSDLLDAMAEIRAAWHLEWAAEAKP
jgi:hypothetical protein